ncbi:MAG TPA: PD-(D/E)XK nuclease family protein [Polyangiaceae bacterium]|nr:PD-(D/E)XK nuclease family protein [Polyangiaceae bacterium]
MRLPPALPAIAPLAPLPHVAASELHHLLECPLHYVLDRDAQLRRLQPYAGAAIVGTAAHATLAALTRAFVDGAPGVKDSTRSVARKLFDAALERECLRRDKAIAERGELPGDSRESPPELPFYGLTRARLARLAEERFGARWCCAPPRLASRSGQESAGEGSRAPRIVEVEYPLRSRDGLVRGIADSIDGRNGQLVIEELKSGEATPERLAIWRQQLLIYAELYRELHGLLPGMLRVQSLPSGVHEFSCTAEECAQAADGARAALLDLNRRIEDGATIRDLARPSAKACANCAHRPWCEAYWTEGMPGSTGSDFTGTVSRTDGWETTLVLDGGQEVRVDFKAVQLVPAAGSRLRVCGVRADSASPVRCGRNTAVWRVPL